MGQKAEYRSAKRSREMLSALGLQNIKVRFLPADMVYAHYLSGRKMDIASLNL